MTTGRIFEIKRFAVHDGPGIRTTFFFKGCPLNCIWCHNPEGLDYEPELAFLERKCVGCGDCFAACPEGLHTVSEDGAHVIDRENCTLCGRCVEACMPRALKLYGELYTPAELFELALLDRDFYAQSGGGVTCSGGEALVQSEFVSQFLSLCKNAVINTAVDTSGYAPWLCFEKVLPFTDLFLYDLKHIDSEKHKALTGSDNGLILDNLCELSKRGVPVEIRMPVIPGHNDSEHDIARTVEFLRSIRSLILIRPLPYHALSGSKYASIGKVSGIPAATGEENEAAMRVSSLLEDAGLPVCYPD